ERAIVTEIAGTTRDAVEALLDTRPIPLRLVDTAGLRETRELVERIGIEVGARWLARAHLVVACGETDQDALSVLEKIRTITTAPITAVRTKADLTGELAGSPRSQPSPLAVSAHTGAGLSRLLQVIHETLARDRPLPAGNAPIVTRARQRRALSEALAELKAFGTEWSSGRLPAPVAAVHTRAAIHALETLIGGVDVEEVLGRVFSEFCVGK